MSRSNLSGNVNPNPAKYFFQWSSEYKCFKYYNKEKGENVLVKLPFRCLVIDVLATIKGYSDAEQSGFWANEVRNTKTDELIVKTKGGIVAKGMYDDIINSRDMQGSKFCQSVYIMWKEPSGDFVLANIQLTGAALGSWFDFLQAERKANKDYNIIFKKCIEIAKTEEGKKGVTKFNKPIFKLIDVTPEADEQAKIIDIELQEYLTEYLGKSKVTQAETQQEEQTNESLGSQSQKLYGDTPPPTMNDAPEEKDDDKGDFPF